MLDLKDISNKIIETAKKAGTYIKTESEHFNTDKVRNKGINDLVSYVDLEAEKMIVKSLRTILPEAGFITEEKTIIQKEADYNWVIDPLDGTTNFIHGLSPYAVSIALDYKDDTLIGVIYEIKSEEVFSAIKLQGAFLNNKPTSVSKADALSNSLIGTGFPYKDYEALDGYLNSLKFFIMNTQGVRRQGSAAIDLAHVACGRLDAFYEYNLNPWDVRAGILLVREAGGKVSDFAGTEGKLDGSEIIASNKNIYSEFYNDVKNNFFR